jgi:cytochrome c-type biogenesis protein CcmE
MAHGTVEHAPQTAAAPVARKRSLAPLIIAALIALLGVAVIGTSTSGGAGNYNYSIAQLTKDMDEVAGKSIKVAGTIAKGSVRGQPASDSFRFDLADTEGNKVSVAYKKLLPDPFEEGRDAIVSGKVVNGVLRASNLTVKCPSRYEDSEQLTDEQKKRYLQSDPGKHAEMYKQDQGE